MPEPTTPLIERPWEDVERMLDVDAALQHVLSAFAPLEAISIPLLEAATMVLAADVFARDDVPPFRNSAMDGYAVRAADTASATWSAPVELPVASHVAAGQRDVPRLARWRGDPHHDGGAAAGGGRRGGALRGDRRIQVLPVNTDETRFSSIERPVRSTMFARRVRTSLVVRRGLPRASAAASRPGSDRLGR